MSRCAQLLAGHTNADFVYSSNPPARYISCFRFVVPFLTACPDVLSCWVTTKTQTLSIVLTLQQYIYFLLQICGAFPDSMSRCAQLLADHTNADFVDINCGCPIDLVFNKVSLIISYHFLLQIDKSDNA